MTLLLSRRDAEMVRKGISGVWCVVLAVIALVMSERSVLAQHRDHPARQLDNRTVIRRGAAEPVIDGHGWMIEVHPADAKAGAGASRPERAVLLSLPAREMGGANDAGTEDMQGVVRVVGELPGRWAAGHEGLAWWRNRVFVAVENESDARRRRVFSREALRGMGSFYEYIPLKQFMEMATLPPSDALLGMAATEAGPVAMQLSEERGTGGTARAALWLLAGSEWSRVSLPWESVVASGMEAPAWEVRREGGGVQARRAGLTRLMSWRDGLAITICDEGDTSVVVWVGQIDVGSASPEIRWRRMDFEMGVLAGADRGSMRLVFVEGARAVDDALVAVVFSSAPESTTGSEARVYQLREARKPPLELSVVRGLGRGAIVIPMASPGAEGESAASGLVTLVWRTEPVSGAAGSEASGLALREISAITGRTMYEGPSWAGKQVQRPMLQWIVLIVLLASVGCAVYGRTTDLRVMPTLPAGVRPADLVRRLVAAILDYAPSAILVAILEGRSALVMLNPATMLGGADASLGDMDLQPLGMAIGITILHTSVCEWLIGKSLGKFVMGVRVVSIAIPGAAAGPGADDVQLMDRPGLVQSLVRNVVRWVVPMLAVFGMLDVAGRHPGDLAARTLVVADPNDGK